MCYLILPVRLTTADAKRLTACLTSLVIGDDRPRPSADFRSSLSLIA